MDVEEFIAGHNIKIKKSMDQHFLTDESILAKEIELAGLKKSDIALEIGAGVGNLTKKIAEHCKVLAVEKNAQFIPLLKGVKNTEIIHADALPTIKNLNFNKIISNIPYSISQPLLLELLKHKWDIAVLIVQKEFALKMLAKSKLAVLVNDCCDFGIESFVSGSSFYPPAVDSALIALRQKKPMDDKFWKFLSKIYMQKNRNVKNVVSKFPEELAQKKVHQLGIKELKAIYEMINQ